MPKNTSFQQRIVLRPASKVGREVCFRECMDVKTDPRFRSVPNSIDNKFRHILLVHFPCDGPLGHCLSFLWYLFFDWNRLTNPSTWALHVWLIAELLSDTPAAQTEGGTLNSMILHFQRKVQTSISFSKNKKLQILRLSLCIKTLPLRDWLVRLIQICRWNSVLAKNFIDSP